MFAIVKWYSEQKGYGFLIPIEGGKDVFVHANSLQKSGTPPLKENQRVDYDIMVGKKGPEAINVHVV